VRLGSLVADYPAPRLAAARLQAQALCSLPFLAFAATGGSGGGSASLDLRLGAHALGEWAARTLSWASGVSGTQAALLCLSAATAVSGTLLQFEGQRSVPAAAAQPIYASSPILTALWALVLLREPVNANEALGALGVCGAAALAGAARAEGASTAEARDTS